MRTRLLLALAGAAIVVLVVLYVLAVGTERGRRADARVVAVGLEQTSSPRVRAAAERVLQTIDIGSLVLLGGGLVAVALARRRPHAALAAAVAIAGANVTTQLLKPG